MYFIEKNLTRLRNNQCTFFLNPKELNELKRKLGKENYNIYYPYKDSEKVIVYTDTEPIVMLYEIKSKIELRHQDILGTIFSLNISEELFGDILIINGRYFIYIFPLINSYFVANFLMVKNSKIELEQIDYKYLEDYERNYQRIKLIVSSLRIDTIVAKICQISRGKINEMIKKKEIMLNYDFLKDGSYKLGALDTFSIKRVGKFKFHSVIGNTKGKNLILEIDKY